MAISKTTIIMVFYGSYQPNMDYNIGFVCNYLYLNRKIRMGIPSHNITIVQSIHIRTNRTIFNISTSDVSVSDISYSEGRSR